MIKTTNPGWPEPTDWANDLVLLLRECGSNYEGASDTHEKQKALSNMLARLSKQLRSLPPVENEDLFVPMMHLSDALAQASEGHKPTLLANRRDNPTRKASVYWMTAKMQAVVAYFTLSEAGHATPAEIVMKEMNKAGLRRRQGEEQTEKSIQRFVESYALQLSDEDGEPWVAAAKAKLDAFRSSADWPVSIADALAYTRKSFASKRLKPFISDPQS
jgi:hypothetical protein